jgi:hypothetical protein
MIRLVTVAVLLGTAAVTVWSSPGACPPGAPGQAASRRATPGDATSRDATSRDATPGDATPRGTGAVDAGPVPAPPEGGPATSEDRQSGGAAPVVGRRPVPPGAVGVPVRLAEPVTLRLLRPGDRVDLFAVDPSGGGADLVASDAVVLTVTATADTAADGGLLLALLPAEARRALSTPQRTGFAVLVQP